MIRVVLAVLLTVAVLAAVTPAVDEGRAARTAIHLDDATERIERAAESLRAHEDPTRPGVAGARRIVRFQLPDRSWTAVGARLWIDGERNLIGYRLDGRRSHRVTLRGLDLRTPDGPVVFEDSGRYRLVLSLVRSDGVGVVISRG
ncbi:MAG: hypothetical protein V5A16_01845 [Haloplanus sp.]